MQNIYIYTWNICQNMFQQLSNKIFYSSEVPIETECFFYLINKEYV